MENARERRQRLRNEAQRRRRESCSTEETEARRQATASYTQSWRLGQAEAVAEERRRSDAEARRIRIAAEVEVEAQERRRRNAEARRIQLATQAHAQAHERRRRNAERWRLQRQTILQRATPTLRSALEVNFAEDLLLPHSSGELTFECQFCKAKHFLGEKPNDNMFNYCCHKGSVKIVRANIYPAYLRDLISSTEANGHTNFLNNIRSFNSSLAFASMGAAIAPPPGHGPYCFRVHGQVYHTTSHLQPPNGEQPKYAQLYIVDPPTALDHRLRLPENEGCDPELMKNLDYLMRELNPFVAAYRMLKEVEESEKEKALAEDRPPREVSLALRSDRVQDKRRYNLPTHNEVAMVFVDQDGEPPFERDIRIYPRTPTSATQFVQLNILNPNLDPMTYPIFFPHGEKGWQPNLQLQAREYGPQLKRKCISMLQYKQFQIAIRENTFNPILHGGRLFQQWIVDSYLQVEANNLNYVRLNQKKLRVEQYKGLWDYVNEQCATTGAQLGKALILPSSFQGSPRNMRERYHDGMSIVGKFGIPDVLLTFTCNPNCQEIISNLFLGQQASDRPDLVARVFSLKLGALLDDVLKKHVLGKVIAWVYSIEFQKRGLPHVHMLLFLADDDKPRTAEQVDRLITAEIPDKLTNPRLFEIVTRCMIHGPCGALNPKSPCMDNGVCTKKFPKPLRAFTNVNIDGYPQYRRQEMPHILIRGKPVDNRWVVPYNKWLTAKYNAHINLEVCTSMSVVKYLFKYIYKGYDCAQVEVLQTDGVHNHDELKTYVDARYVSAPEAAWRLFQNNMHDKSHTIQRLAVHLQDMQLVQFLPGQEQAAANENHETTLTFWFKLNSEQPNARQYLYTDIPSHYVYTSKGWKTRKIGGNKIISRMYTVSPRDQERFFLRLLLLHVPGAMSFEHLRTVKGARHETFLEAARALNLLQDDNEWDNTLIDASHTALPAQIRQLFVSILVFGAPSNPVLLFDKHKKDMYEDYTRDHSEFEAEQMLLSVIQELLSFHGSKCFDYGLPEPQHVFQNLGPRYDAEQEWAKYIELASTFNPQQQEAFNELSQAIENESQTARAYYLDGPGGSGKTYLYTALISWVRGKHGCVLSHATTGIAAILLPAGRTAHSGFKLPVPLLETSTSSLRPRSEEAAVLREAKLLIIDEASMLQNHGLRCIDKLLREIMCNETGVPSTIPFGGKPLLLGGDFRQTLPVVPRGSRAELIESCIKSSPLWKDFKVLRLTTNMRAGDSNNSFSEWLLKIGDGIQGNDMGLGEDIIEIPEDMVECEDLIRSIFGDQIDTENVHRLSERVILAAKNNDTLELNEKILNLLPGESRTYYSADSIVSDDPSEHHRFPLEFLHQQTPSGMPPHVLTLKVGAIVMLMRNLNRDLCNGTRFVVKAMHDRFLDLEVLTGRTKGERIILPRIDMAPSDTHLPFTLKRRQFPIRLAFAITINKSQGQTFKFVGLYLPEPVFSHGQLYVALSRVGAPERLKVWVKDSAQQGRLIEGSNRTFTRNVVFREVLDNFLMGSIVQPNHPNAVYAEEPIQIEMNLHVEDYGFEFGFDDPAYDLHQTYLYEEEMAHINLNGVEFEPTQDTSRPVWDRDGNMIQYSMPHETGETRESE